VTKIVNGNNLTSIYVISMCNTSSENTHSGDFSRKISTLLILFFLTNVPQTFCLRFQCSCALARCLSKWAESPLWGRLWWASGRKKQRGW